MRPIILSAVAAIALVLAACATAEVEKSSEVVGSQRVSPTPSHPERSSASASPADSSDLSLGRVTIPGEPVGWDTASVIVRGSDRYLALGWHLEPANEVGYGGGGRLWTSPDGTAWERLELPAELGTAGLVSLVATPRKEFLLFGNAYDAENVLRPIVMRSADGHRWEVEEVDLPSRLYLTRVVSGPKGYLLAGRDDGPGGLWLSADGLAWRSVQVLTQTTTTYESITDIGAGDDGFVAVGVTGAIDGDSTNFVLASADGVTWIRSNNPFPIGERHAPPALVAPIGGDWVATTTSIGTATRFWRSANGLQWESASVLGGVAPVSPILASAGDRLFYSSTATQAPVGEPGGWTSDDGVSWTRVDLGPDGVLAGAYEDDRGLILAGAVIVSAHRADAAFWRTGD